MAAFRDGLCLPLTPTGFRGFGELYRPDLIPKSAESNLSKPPNVRPSKLRLVNHESLHRRGLHGTESRRDQLAAQLYVYIHYWRWLPLAGMWVF
jgi:hypothetical protein